MSFEFENTEAYKRVRKNLIKDLPKADDDIKKVENLAIKKPSSGYSLSGFGKNIIRKLRGKLRSYNKGKSSGLRFLYLHCETSIVPLLIYNKGKFKQEDQMKEKLREQLKEVKQELDINDE